MSRVISSLGRARNSSQVQRRGSSNSPMIEKSHSSSEVCGVGPAERTGKSAVTYWPGGTRAGSTSAARRPRNPRETTDFGLLAELQLLLMELDVAVPPDEVGIVDDGEGWAGGDA